MSPVVTISGGGIIGNYISSRLNSKNIKSIVIEKSKEDVAYNQNIRTLTLNPFSKRLLDDIGIDVNYSEIKQINVLDGEGTGSINFSAKEINSDNLSYVVFFNDLKFALQKKELERTLFQTHIKDIKAHIAFILLIFRIQSAHHC